MKSRRTRNIIAAPDVAVAIVAGGAASAQALTSQTAFTTIVPRFQQSHYWQYETKTTSNPSQVHFDFIGGGYHMNVKAQNGETGTQYSEVTYIGTGVTKNIPNSTPSGKPTRLIVTNQAWTTVDVTVTGWFQTN